MLKKFYLPLIFSALGLLVTGCGNCSKNGSMSDQSKQMDQQDTENGHSGYPQNNMKSQSRSY